MSTAPDDFSDEWEDPELERGDYEFTERKDREVTERFESSARKQIEHRSRLLQALQACGARLEADRIIFPDQLAARVEENDEVWWFFSGEKFFFSVEKVLDKKALTDKILRVHIELLNQ